jgi:hypothetical protein
MPAREQLALTRLEQFVAPLDRRTHRPLAGRRVARPLREEGEPLAQPQQHRLRREHADVRGRELESERQPVEPAANLRDGVAVLVRQPKGVVGVARARHEQVEGVARGERRDRVHVLPANAQRLATRHQ